jgi:Tfp pilus assembly protein PilX
MKAEESRSKSRNNERGAALVTVIMITVILGIACVFMLKAAGAVSGEASDVLSETKAYYSAEAGIQSTINIVRNASNVTYKSAVTPASSNAPTDPSTFGRLSAYLTYADPTLPSTSANGRVIIDNASPSSYQAYAVEVYDPDNTQTSVTFSGSVPSTTAPAPNPNPGGTPNPNRSTISMTLAEHTATFSSGATPITTCQPLGAITLTNSGTGVATTQTVDTRIDFHVPVPKPSGSTRTFYSTVTFMVNGASPVSAVVKSKATGNVYNLGGSNISVYTSSTCALGTEFSGNNGVTVVPGTSSTNLWVTITPFEPYRLRLVSKGYGPNGAYKELEAVIQRNFFNNLSSPAAISMVGPGASLVFDPGPAHTLDILGGTNPSVGVSDTTGLDAVNGAHVNGSITPAPVVLGDDLPDWQRSTYAMDAFLAQLRETAQNNGRYFTSQPNCQNNPSCFGDPVRGTGLTFCNASCDLSQDGGGILVVTGTLSMSGNIGFKGLIIVTGAGGVQRSGNGNSVIQGNLVIAPYDPAHLGNGFMSPVYHQNGGAGDVINDNFAVDTAFDGSSAISDFILGVAEK